MIIRMSTWTRLMELYIGLWLVAAGANSFPATYLREGSSDLTTSGLEQDGRVSSTYWSLRPVPASSLASIRNDQNSVTKEDANSNGSPLRFRRNVRADIISLVNRNQGDGTYYYSYETSNGIRVQESGSVPGPKTGTIAQGEYSYTSPEGRPIRVSYTAGQDGFVPRVLHLPATEEAAQPQNAKESAGDGGQGFTTTEVPPTTETPWPEEFPLPAAPGVCIGVAASLCG